MNRNDIATSYRESAVRGAGQVELAVMLYDILLDDIQRAVAAIAARDIETRTTEIRHALGVLEHLQGGLNFEKGGDAARYMDRLYSIVRAKLLEAHINTSAEILQKQIDLLIPIRDAWKQVSPSHPRPAESLPKPAESYPQSAEYDAPPQLDEPVTTEWRI